jgi:Bacterial TSP3 repeat
MLLIHLRSRFLIAIFSFGCIMPCIQAKIQTKIPIITQATLFADADNDGLTDDEEADLGTNPNNPDTDGDGLTDYEEATGIDNETTPLLAFEISFPIDPCSPNAGAVADSDCDGDGLNASDEAINGSDPATADTDGDGVTDGDEILGGMDPTTQDSDNDGLTDGEEFNGIDDLSTGAEAISFSEPINPCSPNTCGLYLSVKILLGAVYDPANGLMHDDLRNLQMIPANQPYGGLDFTDFGYFGTESITDMSIFDVTGADAIVDWVLIELHDESEPSVVSARRAALVQRDGDIVSIDGISPVVFTDLAAMTYFVAAKHRNHLGVMTRDPILFENGSTVSIDFTTQITPNYVLDNALTSNFPQQLTTENRLVLWPGNTYGDDEALNAVIFQGVNADPDQTYFQMLLSVLNADFSTIFILPGYFRGDTNLDGKTIYQGENSDSDLVFFTLFLHPENTLFLPIFTINEQVP